VQNGWSPIDYDTYLELINNQWTLSDWFTLIRPTPLLYGLLGNFKEGFTYYFYNLNSFKLLSKLNLNKLNTYILSKITNDYNYKFKFNKLLTKKYSKKTVFNKYYDINIIINKDYMNIINNNSFYLNYTNFKFNEKTEITDLKKKKHIISKTKNFYKLCFFFKYIYLRLNKYWMPKNISQINKVYVYNNLHYKKLLLINKILLFKVKFKLDNNKISNQYKFKYNFYEKESLNNYINLKLLLPPIPEGRFINISQQLNLLRYNVKSHIIFNYMYINKSTVQHYFIKFFKNTKILDDSEKDIEDIEDTEDKEDTEDIENIENIEDTEDDDGTTTYFFNCWQGLLTGWKNARQFHWDIYNKNKSLKKRRYRNFLPPFLKKNKIIQNIIINHFTFKFNFSNIFWDIFTKLYLHFFNKNIKIKEIFQIPINYLFWIFLTSLKNDKLKIKKKIDLWLDKNSKIKKTFWMSIKKKIPKFFTKQTYKIKNLKNIIQYDYITNYFCILKEKKNYITLNDYIFSNKLLKLHNFRYKA